MAKSLGGLKLEMRRGEVPQGKTYLHTPLPFVCGGYCTDTVKLAVENTGQWLAILSSTVSCRSRRVTRQQLTLLLCL